jgi:hypothetical protein
MNAPNLTVWLLKSEPDLTPDQVWTVMALSETGTLMQETVIADTRQQVVNELLDMQWTPLVVMNEPMIDRTIADAENQSAVVARDVCLEDLRHARSSLQKIRRERGNGAILDGRFPDDDLSRSQALEAERLPGGRDQLDKEINDIRDMCERVQARRKLTQKMAGVLPPEEQTP